MHRFFWLRFILTLILAGGLVAGGVLLYHTGFTNGYNAAVIAGHVSGLPNTTSQLPFYGYGPFGYGLGFPFFFPLFPLVGIGLFFLFIFLIGGLFRFWGWRHMASRPDWQKWAHEHGHMPPTGPEEQTRNQEKAG